MEYSREELDVFLTIALKGLLLLSMLTILKTTSMEDTKVGSIHTSLLY